MTRVPPARSLWRWIGTRMSLLAVAAVVLIAFGMWLHFFISDRAVLERIPEADRAELQYLQRHPHTDEARLWQLLAEYYPVENFMPGIANRDWLLLATLVAGAIPLIIMFGFWSSRPLSRQFSSVATAARRVAQGDFSTRLSASHNGPEEMQRLVADFNSMTTQLARYEREIGESSAMIAHELRTPLNAAMGRLQGMLDEVFPCDTHQVAMIQHQLQQLNKLVSDLHLLSLAGAGQLALSPSTFDLCELIAERVSWFDAPLRALNIAPEIRAPRSLIITADKDRIGQVLNITLENALRYACQGRYLAIELTCTAQDIVIAIEDAGPGFAEEDLDNAFNRFWRAERSRARYSGGSGLGLSIAKAICVAHGGVISAQNRAGGGAKISLRLPR